jgi:3-hydroxyacyl-[acyl-carrier-protein] dehydratase
MRFQFVDRIQSIKKFKYARGIKTVTFEEGFLDSPGGERGCIPRTLLIECAAQLASWLVLYSTDYKKIPLMAKINQAVIEYKVKCGTEMILEVEVESWKDDGTLINCKTSVDGQIIGKGDRCLCTFVSSEKLVDPKEMKIRFQELSKGADIE